MILRRLTLFVCVLTVLALNASAQSSGSGTITNKLLGSLNAIQTTVPFLSIAPDSRAGAMGDLGAATRPDVNSQHWNAAKYAFIENKTGVSLAYTPWLRNIVNDINLAYLSAYYRFDDRQTISASLKYFSLGEVIFRDIEGVLIGNFHPNEFALDAGYSRLLSDYLSGALVMRFVRSDITGGGTIEGQQYNAGYSFAADLGFYYQHPLDIANQDGEIAWGVNFSNLGTKISYTEGSDKQFIPASLRAGARYTLGIDEYNSITASFDLSKLLVPSPPIYYADSTDLNGDPVIQYGKKTPASLPLSWIQSFYDAPDGFREEMHEIMFSVGLEYWYREQFAIRIGYFNEHENKGNRKYFATGIGMNLNVFFLDFSYLISTSGRNNPLANTMRFTLGLNFDY
ncbi:MAG: type IX secretion system outer membrane channel protein PorV [Bacteroidales bacterium]|nr:type IX secretion system outer membrane channel protein PorV [Bacteroidales bacterium]